MARKRTGVITESLEQLRQLEQEYQGKPAAPRIAMLIHLKTSPGHQLDDVAPLVGYSSTTVKRWWQLYMKHGLEALLYTGQAKRQVKNYKLALLREKLTNGDFESIDEVRRWLDDRGAQRSQDDGAKGARATTEGRQGRKSDQPPESAPALDGPLKRFVTSLPQTTNFNTWIDVVREGLRILLGDIDRVSIVVNLGCDLRQPESYRPSLAVTRCTLYKEGSAVDFLPYDANDEAHSGRLIEGLRKTDFPLDEFHPPATYSYYYQGVAYLGVIALWRERRKTPISAKTLQTMNDLQNFLEFLLADVIVRHELERPVDRLFQHALDRFTRQFELTLQEQRILIYMMHGYSQKRIAALLNVSQSTVRFHIQAIYTKADVHSLGELFARHFTPHTDMS